MPQPVSFQPVIKNIRPDLADVLAAHFMSLSPDSRRSRFMASMGEDGVSRYLSRRLADMVILAVDEDLVCGVAEIFRTDDGVCEIGISVLDNHQGRGIGRNLLSRAIEEARASGMTEMDLVFSPQNASIRRLVHHFGGAVSTIEGQCFSSISIRSPCTIA